MVSLETLDLMMCLFWAALFTMVRVETHITKVWSDSLLSFVNIATRKVEARLNCDSGNPDLFPCFSNPHIQASAQNSFCCACKVQKRSLVRSMQLPDSFISWFLEGKRNLALCEWTDLSANSVWYSFPPPPNNSSCIYCASCSHMTVHK